MPIASSYIQVMKDLEVIAELEAIREEMERGG
jgi:hypothetical protein